MSVVVAVRSKQRTWIASDSRVTFGDRVEVCGPKFFVRDGVAYGFTGSLVTGAWLREATIPERNKKEQLLAWANRALGPWLLASARDRGTAEVSDGASRLPGSVLLADKRSIVIVSGCGGCFTTSNHYAAIGNGADAAMGALCALNRYGIVLGHAAARAAVMAACAHSSSCGQPVYTQEIQ